MSSLQKLKIEKETGARIRDYQEELERSFVSGWTNDNVDMKQTPEADGPVTAVLSLNTQVTYRPYDENWDLVRYEDKEGYVKKGCLAGHKLAFRDLSGAVNKTKSFMPYTAITSVSSRQYRLQQIACTGTYGIRQVHGRYCVAVGSYYTTEIGTYFDLVLENGTVIPCILADCKSDRHTDASRRVTFDGSLAEFVVDMDALEKRILRSGDVSSAQESWNSPVKFVRIYEKRIQ